MKHTFLIAKLCHLLFFMFTFRSESNQIDRQIDTQRQTERQSSKTVRQSGSHTITNRQPDRQMNERRDTHTQNKTRIIKTNPKINNSLFAYFEWLQLTVLEKLRLRWYMKLISQQLMTYFYKMQHCCILLCCINGDLSMLWFS